MHIIMFPQSSLSSAQRTFQNVPKNVLFLIESAFNSVVDHFLLSKL